ncbi:MAG: hypothetical protein DRH37_10535 [Deltaproteobacteria bacterium]|nr:MAG: hypothetical protein DRH37_10535 [Deltaproteobacteria bacterium]
MAIDFKDFRQTKYPNLFKSIRKDNLKGYKYLMWIKIEGRLYKKILGYSETDKLTDKVAKDKLEKLKQDLEGGYTSDKMNLDELFELYFKDVKDTNWKTIKGSIYNRYIGNYENANTKDISKLTKGELKRKKEFDKNKIGSKNIDKIKPLHINRILTTMNKLELSPRTQKSVLEVLKPMFNFALENKILKENPTAYINVKVPNQKKIVTNATKLFQKVYNGILTYYKDNPFYQALFLFGLTGRRKSEILNLKWENIDFTNNYYWITDTKNDDNQKYPLPPYIKEQLQQFIGSKNGLVFPSPINGGVITNIDRQMRQLKKHIGIDNLSLHYMRNILVSMLAEQQTEAIVLSGILGHKDVNTINKYLSINHYNSGQIGLDKINTILDVEVIK